MGGDIWCTNSSSIASTYMIVRYPMNLRSGCSWAVALPSVWGQVIYLVLFNFLMRAGPAALNTCHVDVISPFSVALLIYFWDTPIRLIWCELYSLLLMTLIYCAVVIFF